jgi:hypothetical protein
MPALRVTQLAGGISCHGVQLIAPVSKTLRFPTLFMPTFLYDGEDKRTKYQSLLISDQIRYTHILCHTTYLGEFTEITEKGKFVYERHYDSGSAEGIALA